MYICKQISDQDATTRDGAQIRYKRTANSEQAGEQMPMPVRFDAQKGSRSEVLSDALGRSSKQREPPRKPAQESYGAERGARTEREASGTSSAALRPLMSCFDPLMNTLFSYLKVHFFKLVTKY